MQREAESSQEEKQEPEVYGYTKPKLKPRESEPPKEDLKKFEPVDRPRPRAFQKEEEEPAASQPTKKPSSIGMARPMKQQEEEEEPAAPQPTKKPSSIGMARPVKQQEEEEEEATAPAKKFGGAGMAKPIRQHEPEPQPMQSGGEGDDDGDVQRLKCPKCGSSKVKEEEDRNQVIAFAPRIIYGVKFRCMSCRNEWI